MAIVTASGVCLRPLDVERDAEALHAVFGDPHSCRYLARPALQSVSETRALLARWTLGTESTSWAVIDEPDGPALGRVSLVPRGDAVWEAAVMIIPSATGRGLGRLGLQHALDHAFASLGARRVFADIDPENVASLRLFERLGFSREGYLRATWRTHLGVRDTVLMALIASDPRPWRQARGA